MFAILYSAAASVVAFFLYELGRCSAVHDLEEGVECEDLQYWSQKDKDN